jgi:uncharacterized protein (DUF342 family)
MIQEDDQRDAGYQVDIAHDKMTATLTVFPGNGGAAASVEAAETALAKMGVVFGVDHGAVAQAVATPGNPVPVAHGERSQPSANAWLETLIDVTHTRGPKEDASGRADFRELGILRYVEPGTPLMRRHPPNPGAPGHTVLGAELAVMKTKDLKFPLHLQGVQTAPDNPDLLIAAIAGQPVVHRDGVSVEPVLTLNDVSLATGNIDFPGTVEIKGDVHAGMKIKCGGDIMIHGIVESAEVESGGEVQVKGGIIGQHGQNREGDAKLTARIRAKGNVRAHHVDNAWIYAEQSVFIDESAVQSEIIAMDEIAVGKQGASKGHIIGGTIRATRAVTAYCLGSPGSSNTKIIVGMNPELNAAFEEKKAAVAAKLKEREDLEKVIKVLQARPGREAMLEKAKATYTKAGEDLNQLLAEQQAIEDQLKLADNAEVAIKAKVFPGTMITIGRRYMLVSDTLGKGVFRLLTQEVAGREDLEVVFTR